MVLRLVIDLAGCPVQHASLAPSRVPRRTRSHPTMRDAPAGRAIAVALQVRAEKEGFEPRDRFQPAGFKMKATLAELGSV
jgi:hypothetical protein